MTSISNFLIFLKNTLRQLDQDEIIEILDHAKPRHYEQHEVMVDYNISYEESVSYF
jgi:hypothetical protein